MKAEIIVHAVGAILTAVGVMGITHNCPHVGYPLFAIGLFWLAFHEN